MTKSIVLVSGGMDSCVTAAIAQQESDELYFLHINYGQRTEKRELKAFNDLAEYYDVKGVLNVDIGYLRDIGGSSLTDAAMDVEDGDVDREEVPTSYVPFRNANILAIATSWAEVLKADHIYIGAVEEDGSGYPDCRQVFYDAFNQLLNVGTHPDVKLKIMTPLIRMKKYEIVQKGMALNAPIHLSWSCYQSEEAACGVCDSCLLRLRGFKQAGLKDPISYVFIPEAYSVE